MGGYAYFYLLPPISSFLHSAKHGGGNESYLQYNPVNLNFLGQYVQCMNQSVAEPRGHFNTLYKTQKKRMYHICIL